MTRRSWPGLRPALPRPDFLRPVQRPGPVAWAWCVTGLLVLAVTLPDAAAAWQQRAQALQVLAMAQARPAAPEARPPRPKPPLAPLREASDDRWLLQLALPWPVVWAAGDAAVDGVQWLSLSHGPSGGLRLSGLAPAPMPAQATAEALRAQQAGGRPVWRSVSLTTLERAPDGWRFELVARLADAPAAHPGLPR